MTPEELVAAALQARKQAYSPYSHFAVGAAIETRDGRAHTGCNVENISYGMTVCAERVAMCTAVAAGDRVWRALAVASDDASTPCGACLQVLAEFAAADLPIYVARPDGTYRQWTLGELLPRPFCSIRVGREM